MLLGKAYLLHLFPPKIIVLPKGNVLANTDGKMIGSSAVSKENKGKLEWNAVIRYPRTSPSLCFRKHLATSVLQRRGLRVTPLSAAVLLIKYFPGGMKVQGGRGSLFPLVMESCEGKELQLDQALESTAYQITQERQMKSLKVNNCLFRVMREVTVAVLSLF